MGGSRYRSEYKGYGLEWYDTSDKRILIIQGGHEYGWAENKTAAVSHDD